MICTTLAPGAPWPQYNFVSQNKTFANSQETIERKKRRDPPPIKVYLSQHPGALSREISDATGYSVNTVSAAMNDYFRKGLVSKVKSDAKNRSGMRVFRFYLNESLH